MPQRVQWSARVCARASSTHIGTNAEVSRVEQVDAFGSLERKTSAWISEERSRLRETVARGFRGGIDRQRARKVPFSLGRITRLQVKRAGVHVRGRIAWVAAHGGLE